MGKIFELQRSGVLISGQFTTAEEGNGKKGDSEKGQMEDIWLILLLHFFTKGQKYARKEERQK